jgi:hypothetical protein
LLVALIVLPRIVGEAANGCDGAELDGIARELAQAAATQQHAGGETRGAGHRGALGVGVGLEGFDDLVDIEHGGSLLCRFGTWG